MNNPPLKKQSDLGGDRKSNRNNFAVAEKSGIGSGKQFEKAKQRLAKFCLSREIKEVVMI